MIFKSYFAIFLILITAHSPSVVFIDSLSIKITFSKELIKISFNLELIIIGAVIFEVKFKFLRYNLTELLLIIKLPSVEFPVIKYSPSVVILTFVPSIVTPFPMKMDRPH